jgi:vitamin B12 transporter
MAPLSAEEVDEIVVSATGIPTPLAQIGASVDIITAEDLERQQITYLQDAISGLKGVTFAQEGTTGGLGYLRMRGLERQNVVVFIDGVNMADAADAQGGTEISNLLVGDIERIEVMRGANSVLYGSNAIAGVIDIRTKEAGGEPTSMAAVSAGSNDFRQMRFGSSGELANGRIGYSLSLQSIDVSPPSDLDEEDTNYSEDEDYENVTASGRFSLEINDATSLSLKLRSAVSSADTDGFDPSPPYTPVDGHFGTDTEQNLISLSAKHVLSDQLTLRASHSFLGNYRDNFAEVGNVYWYDGERDTTDIRAELYLSDETYLSLGLEQKDEKLSQIGLESSVEVGTSAVFGVLHTAFSKLHTTLGFRQNEHDEFGNHMSWRAGLSYPVNDRVTARVNLGNGYRAPSLYELYGRDMTCLDGLCGNRDLEPEESESVDMGFTFEPRWSSFVFDVGYFNIETENRIFYQSLAGPPTYAGNYQNDVGASTSTGTEMSLAHELSKNFSFEVNYTRLNPRTASGAIQNNQPRRLWSFSGTVASNDGRSNLSLTARQVNDRYRVGVRQEDYFVLGFAYEHRLNERVKLTLSGDNVLDEHYQTTPTKSTPRRTFAVGVSASF